MVCVTFSDREIESSEPLGPFTYARVTAESTGSGVSLEVGHQTVTNQVMAYHLAFFDPNKSKWIDDSGREWTKFEVEADA